MDQSQLQLALTHHKAGRLVEAELLYRQILSLNPRQATVLNYHGVLAIEKGQFELAVSLLKRAIAVNPSDANYRCNLGEALRRSSLHSAAIAAYDEAIRLNPQLAVAHNNLGIARAAIGQFDQAIASYRIAIGLLPNYAEAHGNLGNALKELSRLDEAIAECRIAVSLRPESAEGHNQLGAALAKNGDVDDAISEYRMAIQIDPKHADAHSNLGNAFAMLGRVQDAMTSCETAVRLRPDSISAHWNFAVALLRVGDYERGWAEHEWRLKPQAINTASRFSQDAWDGDDLNGLTIVLHAEQGFGDTIQFVRYVPMVASRGGRVIVECQQELVRLFQRVPGVDRIIARGDALPAFDQHAPLMSLPLTFSTRLETVPAAVPYFSANDDLISQWRDRLASAAGGEHVLHVGLCWAGNSIHHNDCYRSVSAAELAPLAMDGVIFHSLQKGLSHSAPLEIRIVDHSEQLKDFAETAALLATLDHVITVDTAVAHLSGALGVPTSVLLSSIPDWRWMLHRQDMAWYPTHRLYRQRRLGEWTEVVQRVARSLRAMLQKRRSELRSV